MEIATAGFTGHSAEEFFGKLIDSGIKRLVDVRVNNISQLAGFAKRDDLRFFLGRIGGIEYLHELRLAPTAVLLKEYRDKKLTWAEYEDRFLDLMSRRAIENSIDRSLFEVPTVLLCSEHDADQCHRRLVVEYLDQKWGGISARHL